MQLRCALIPFGSTTFDVGLGDEDAWCHTELARDDGHLVCSCRQLGTVAALGLRVRPATNADLLHHGVDMTGLLSDWSMTAVVFYLAALLVAIAFDERTLYVDVSHASLPDWLRPCPFTFRGEMLFYIYTRTTVLRIFNVYPGHTMYTRAQLVHVLAVTLAASLLSIVLFQGPELENCTAAAEAIAMVALIIGGVIAAIVRLAFKATNLRSSKHFRKLYYTNKRRRNSLKVVNRKHTGPRGERAAMVAGMQRSDGSQQSRDAMAQGTGGSGRRVKVQPQLKLAQVQVELGGPGEQPSPSPQQQMIGTLDKPRGDGHLMHTSPCRVMRLPSARWLSVAADSVILGFTLQPQDKGIARFVRAAHIGRGLLSKEVFVTYSPDSFSWSPMISESLESSRQTQTDRQPTPDDVRSPGRSIHDSGRAAASLLSRSPHNVNFVAWAFNVGLLSSIWLLTIVVMRSRRIMPQQLRASAIDDDEWNATIISSFALSIAQSLLLVDLVKVLCLTLTCGPALAVCGMDGNRFVSCVKKPLRRAHKILDALL